MEMLLLFFLTQYCFAQTDKPVHEISGKVISYESVFHLAYEMISVEVNGETQRYTFDPEYGKLLFTSFKPGSEMTLRVIKFDKKIDLEKAPREIRKMLVRDYIHEIYINGKWIRLERNKKTRGGSKIFFEKIVQKVYTFDDGSVAFRFDNDKIGYCKGYFKKIINIREGDVITFIADFPETRDGYVFPISGVYEDYSCQLLSTKKGKVFSYLYKQNFVCIGAKVTCDNDTELKVAFPGDEAQQVIDFLKNRSSCTFYYYNSVASYEKFVFDELYAIVSGNDTLQIKGRHFFGGADVLHDHDPVTFTAKISHIERNEKGRILFLLLNNEYYVEINPRFEMQIGHLFKRGVELNVSGMQRIKKTGEVYRRNYKIVTPNRITINGQSYILNQL